MKSPRFLAALAMAAVLTTGATTAHAFTPVIGNATNGQTPMQETEKYLDLTTPLPSPALQAEGDIEVTGEFTKTVNNFPTPTQEGRYLRVTMPIQMDFTYNVDTHTMTSAQGTVVNQSVYATKNAIDQTKIDTEYQKIKMSLAGFDKNVNGITTMGPTMEFVDSIDKADKSKVQLPFELNITAATGPVKKHSLKRIEEAGKSNGAISLPEIEIAENSSVTLTIDKINGQNLGNEELITDQTSLTSHNLKLKFEYAGK